MSTPQLPVGAVPDPQAHAQLDAIFAADPVQPHEVHLCLNRLDATVAYDPALFHAHALLEARLPDLLRGPTKTRRGLLRLVQRISPSRVPSVVGHLIRDRALEVRRDARRYVQRLTAEQREQYDIDRWLNLDWVRKPRRHEASVAKQKALGLPQLQNIGELRALVGIKSEKQLGFLLVASDEQGAGRKAPYTCFEIPKRDGRPRTIAAPCPELKAAQRKILENILYPLPVSDAAHAFVPGRSTVTHAATHSRQGLVVSFDLQDFFPSIHAGRVVGLFASLGYDLVDGRFSAMDDERAVAATLARLCTYTEDPRSFGDGYAPQGAPTSPAISNLVCRRLDGRLSGIANKWGGRYSRYADDLAFSFDGLSDRAVAHLRWWVALVCGQEGFRLNPKKFRIQRRGRRQQVTGIVVNDTLRVPREERRRFRAILHNCDKHGLESQRRDHPSFESWLLGYAAYIHMVHPDEGRPLLKRVRALIGAKP